MDRSINTAPTKRSVSLEKENPETSNYFCNAGELKPGDTTNVRLLISPATNLEWAWRGDDEVEIVSSGKETATTFEREISNAVAWSAVFVSVSAFPVISGLVQGLLIFFATPYITSFVLRWRSEINSAPRGDVHVDPKNGSNVTISFGDRSGR